LVILGLELRASYLLGSTTWATPAALGLGYEEMHEGFQDRLCWGILVFSLKENKIGDIDEF
jgi:hypothetical protein